jgi:hypothetical protein
MEKAARLFEAMPLLIRKKPTRSSPTEAAFLLNKTAHTRIGRHEKTVSHQRDGFLPRSVFVPVSSRFSL